MWLVDNYLRQEASITPADIKFIPLYVGLFVIYRLIITNIILKKLSFCVSSKNRFKFMYRGFDCFHYIMAAILGTLATKSRPYAHCTFYFVDCMEYIPATGDYFVSSMFEKIYFLYFACYYISDVFWIWTSKEIVIMIIHHSLTISMTAICAISARPVIGISVMLLHDYVDAFLYFGKVCSYLGWNILGQISMVIMAVSYFYLRLFGVATIVHHVWMDPSTQPHHSTLWTVGRILSFGLYFCHMYWGYEILWSVKRILDGKTHIHDTRSD